MLLFRLKTSFTGPPPVLPVVTFVGAPIARFFDQVKLLEKERPLDRRFVAFTCKQSYQVLPSGALVGLMFPLYCGNGSSEFKTLGLLLVPKPEYGRPTPCCASVTLCEALRFGISVASSAPSAASPK